MKQQLCQGFEASGIACGLKKNKGKDLGLIYSTTEASVAGVFTRNKVHAPCIDINRKRIQSGIARAIVVNSGNANCCNGERGMADALKVSGIGARSLNLPEDQVLVASTGVIGAPLDVEKIEKAMPGLAGGLAPGGLDDFAEAIMTTDTKKKIASIERTINGGKFTIAGIAKGSGMIMPDMATMLCFVCTDIDASPEILKDCLAASTGKSFNRIIVDGDTSTNDMAVVMANGLSKISASEQGVREIFQEALDSVLTDLAKMIVRDGEGATKFVEVKARGALSENDARVLATTIADSNLVKTALFGQDPNWGRIMAAAGRAAVPFEPEKADIFFNNVHLVSRGQGMGLESEEEAAKILRLAEFTIILDLNMGNFEFSVWTCDLSLDYVKINADYRS